MGKPGKNALYLAELLERTAPANRESLLEKLGSCRHMLPRFGKVQDLLDNTKTINWDFNRINPNLQNAISHYMDNPPTDALGRSLWLTILSSRQSTKTSTTMACSYPKLATIPGWQQFIIADNKERAKKLLTTMHTINDNWPTQARYPTTVDFQTRQLAFTSRAIASIFSEDDKDIGIGSQPSMLHLSECGFMKSMSELMSTIYPAMRPRRQIRVIFESTPGPLPAGADWQQHYFTATRRIGRHISGFYPFFWSEGNIDIWKDDWKLDLEEQRLMDKFGAYGLKLKHLAFRRVALAEEQKLKENPDLFRVWYPFDDLTCWVSISRSSIPSKVIDAIQARSGELQHFTGPYMEYDSPRSNAIYVMGVDPTGQRSNDNAAFVVVEVWRGQWRVVAHYSAHVDNMIFAEMVFDVATRYNNAKVVVERMGAGEMTIGYLRQRGYRNIFRHTDRMFGFPFSSNKTQLISDMVTDLMENFYIPCKNILMQLSSYQNDKHRQRTFRSELVSIHDIVPGTRHKHHWDSVSAIMMACQGARRAPQREAPWLEFDKTDKQQFPQMFHTVAESRERLLNRRKGRDFDKVMRELSSLSRSGRLPRLQKVSLR